MIVMGERETFSSFVSTNQVENILSIDHTVRMWEVSANIVPPQLPPLPSQ